MTRFSHMLLLFLAMLYAGSPALADSWPPPSKQLYLSADKTVRLTVEPCKPGRKDSYDCADGDQSHATGILQQKRKSGGWTEIWRKTLANKVAPTSALVTNSGQFIVTFDNWYGTGFGKNVVAIYNAEGLLIRSFALSDIVPQNYIDAMPHSISSINWSGEHKFTSVQDQLILQIVVPVAQPIEDDYRDNDGYVDFHIDLATGQLVPPSGREWERAKAAVATVNAAQLEWAQQRRRFLTEPLLGPAVNSVQNLRAYVIEGFERLNVDDPDAFAFEVVLPVPGHKGYDFGRSWIGG